MSDGWTQDDGALERTYELPSFDDAIAFVNRVAELAAAEDHHPDVAISYRKVWVKLKTHSAGGITDKDFEVARQIEDTILWRPPDDSALEGTPNKFVFSKGRG